MEPICLDESEVKALRELLAMLMTMESRAGNQDPEHHPSSLIITRELWRDMILRPAQGLRRITTPKLPAAT